MPIVQAGTERFKNNYLQMKKLFTTGYTTLSIHITTLLLRVGFGVLMIPTYGYGKWVNYQDKKGDFYDFMGLGGSISMGLTIFAELFCSVLLVLGLFTRLATIPLIITMLVIISVHDWNLFDKHELAPAFLTGYLAILLLGPGRYSLDAWIGKRLNR